MKQNSLIYISFTCTESKTQIWINALNFERSSVLQQQKCSVIALLYASNYISVSVPIYLSIYECTWSYCLNIDRLFQFLNLSIYLSIYLSISSLYLSIYLTHLILYLSI